MNSFTFICPSCGKKYLVTNDMLGQSVTCLQCGTVITVNNGLHYVPANQDNVILILGILSLILWLIPFFSLPLPIIGLVMAGKKNHGTGILLNAIGLGLSALWTIVCVLSEM